MIPLCEPSLRGRELEYATACIESGWISSNGEYVRRMEEALANYLGVDHVVEFATGGATLDVKVFEALKGVSRARADNGGFQLQVTELHLAVPALLDELDGRGIALTELRTHSATLEDVFVTLTGRHLRED